MRIRPSFPTAAIALVLTVSLAGPAAAQAEPASACDADQDDARCSLEAGRERRVELREAWAELREAWQTADEQERAKLRERWAEVWAGWAADRAAEQRAERAERLRERRTERVERQADRRTERAGRQAERAAERAERAAARAERAAARTQRQAARGAWLRRALDRRLAGAGSADDSGVIRADLGVAEPASAPGQQLGLWHYTITAGTELAPHTHPGTQLARVVSGQLEYTVDSGEGVLLRADGSSEPMGPGTYTLRPGDGVIEHPEMVHHAVNRTRRPVTIISATLFDAGEPNATVVEDASVGEEGSTPEDDGSVDGVDTAEDASTAEDSPIAEASPAA